MSRCDYDTIFQRVFCVTLVAIALTFTVILTNVFVDIDGLLSSKDKLKTYDVPVPVLESELREVKVASMIRPETFYKQEKNYDERNDDNYRNKRSLESTKFRFHVKNPKIKNILSNRLATLLEELDAEENLADSKNPKDDAVKLDIPKTKEEESNKDATTTTDKTDEEDMLHLAMHNILLQGLIRHVDLNDIYKKVHALVKNIKESDRPNDKTEKLDEAKEQSEKYILRKRQKEYKPLAEDLKEININGKNTHNPSLEEGKLFDELIKCEKLKNDVTNTNHIKNTEGRKDMKSVVLKGPQLLIRTTIDITSDKNNQHKEPNGSSKETIKGIVKLIYNGKSIKFRRMEEDENQQTTSTYEKPSEPITESVMGIKDIDVPQQIEEVKPQPERRRTSNTFLNSILDDYFMKYPKRFKEEQLDNVDNKRLKRHIKIRFDDDSVTTMRPKPKKNGEDDELFVEIETHFDGKGIKGEKKKKLIRSIIEKIQNVIHANIDQFNVGKKKKHKHVQVKKRTINPLDKDKKLLINKIIFPSHIVHSAPISKVVPLPNPMPAVSDKSGETWKRTYMGPGFLTASKSLNSAELGELDVDYNKVMPASGIPQRLQKPLNTDVNEEMLNANTYFDMGNLKFFIKDIEGTGLSIGYNQYTDEAPDPETIKLFTGIEHLVKNYHQNEGTEGTPTNPEDKLKSVSEETESEDQLSKRDEVGNSNDHFVYRRSVQETREKDYHSNEYKIIFNNDFLPYKSYQEIYDDKKKRVAFTINNEPENLNTYDQVADNAEVIKENIEIKELPALLDDKNKIFHKKLKPSEILSIASLLDRKKRSVNIQKTTNLNKKMKLNRYLNTRAMSRKKIILKKKRSKREINKIRIIATDMNKPRHSHSEENIYLVGDENILSDRAILHEVETPEVIDRDEKIDEQYDMIPTVYEEPSYASHVFEGRSRHNQLMSKYPHIFLEELSKSKEDFDSIISSHAERKSQYPKYDPQDLSTIITEKTTHAVISVPRIEDLVEAFDPKQNYKVTVKIFPKNVTGVNSGFKEVHASINKSYNKDGLTYSHLVNVSEISKVENINNKTVSTTPIPGFTQSVSLKHIQEQQNQMDILLTQHKQRIDAQLDHLNKERVAVRTLQQKVIEHSSSKPDQVIPMINDDVSKLVASALLQIQNKGDLTTTSTTSNPTTTTTPKPIENINNEILNQINRNTQMLQTFLEKLTEKLSKESLRQKSEETRRRYDFKANFWKPFHEPYETKNASNLPIPFVFGYQQPYHLNNVHPIPHIPVASVVYHGHIRTNCNHRADPKCKEETDGVKNETKTKYFLEDLVNLKMQTVKVENTSPPVEVGNTSTKIPV